MSRVCLKCGLRAAGCGSRLRNAGRGSRNAGQLEENAVTDLRLSKMRCVSRVAGCETRVTNREMRVALAKCQGIGVFYGVPLYLCNSFVLSQSRKSW